MQNVKVNRSAARCHTKEDEPPAKKRISSTVVKSEKADSEKPNEQSVKIAAEKREGESRAQAVGQGEIEEGEINGGRPSSLSLS